MAAKVQISNELGRGHHDHHDHDGGEEEGKGVMVNSHVISDEADGKEENVDDDHVDDSGDDKNTVNRHREFLATKVCCRERG